MTNYDGLIEQLDLLTQKGQQLQYQAEMLTRRLPAARTALETIAKGDIKPDVEQIAREALGALDELDALNAFDAPEAFASLAEALETQIPPVTFAALKRFRELIESLTEELELPADGHHAKGSIATHGMQNLVEKACGPGSDARVLSRRNGVLEMLLWEGYLAPLQTCMHLPEAVLQLFATISFTYGNHNPEVFIARLRLEGYGSKNKPSLASLDEETSYRRLLHRYRGMGVVNQQLEYKCSVAERKMAIARTALETIANGEADPVVLKLARETLDGFNVLSDGEKFVGFFIGVQQGDAIASIDPIDLQHFHEEWKNISAGRGKGAAIGLGAMTTVKAAADAGPLHLRNSLLNFVLMQDLLGDWQQGTELDGSVYRVAATIPLNGVQFDPEAFVTRLKAERSA